MVYQRQMGEPVDLRAALPQVGKIQRYNYDEAIRDRLRPIDAIGQQQNMYSARKAQEAQAAAYQQRLSALRNAAQGASFGAAPPVDGKWYNPFGNGLKPWFGYGAQYKDGGSHKGYDFSAKAGTPVYAPNNGVINFAGWDDTGFGNAIKMQLGDYTGIYGHLSSFAPGIKPGMEITPGMLLGYVGSTGNSTGNHLHYELQNALGQAFDFGSWYGW